ncbi:hypothetical protein VCCP1040_2247, partial [Vibrio cholerae CP1040(13)]
MAWRRCVGLLEQALK